MTAKQAGMPDESTGGEQRKPLSEKQIKDLELAGGVEGGMEAGSAGGPSQQDAERGNAGKRTHR